jgi:hypothetical protein
MVGVVGWKQTIKTGEELREKIGDTNSEHVVHCVDAISVGLEAMSPQNMTGLALLVDGVYGVWPDCDVGRQCDGAETELSQTFDKVLVRDQERVAVEGRSVIHGLEQLKGADSSFRNDSSKERVHHSTAGFHDGVMKDLEGLRRRRWKLQPAAWPAHSSLHVMPFTESSASQKRDWVCVAEGAFRAALQSATGAPSAAPEIWRRGGTYDRRKPPIGAELRTTLRRRSAVIEETVETGVWQGWEGACTKRRISPIASFIRCRPTLLWGSRIRSGRGDWSVELSAVRTARFGLEPLGFVWRRRGCFWSLFESASLTVLDVAFFVQGCLLGFGFWGVCCRSWLAWWIIAWEVQLDLQQISHAFKLGHVFSRQATRLRVRFALGTVVRADGLGHDEVSFNCRAAESALQRFFHPFENQVAIQVERETNAAWLLVIVALVWTFI